LAPGKSSRQTGIQCNDPRIDAEHPIEVVGKELRAMMPWLKKNEIRDKTHPLKVSGSRGRVKECAA
jgi:hypothetical protein